MFKSSADIALKHKRFLKEVIGNQEVWTLKNNDGYVSSSSHHFEDEDEDEDEEPLLLQIFWSNSKEAKVCARHVWAEENFLLQSISLNEFIEFWCVGMHQDNVIVGTNFDYQLFGYEEAPLVLANDILQRLKNNNIYIKLNNYNSIDEFLEIIKSNL